MVDITPMTTTLSKLANKIKNNKDVYGNMQIVIHWDHMVHDSDNLQMHAFIKMVPVGQEVKDPREEPKKPTIVLAGKREIIINR